MESTSSGERRAALTSALSRYRARLDRKIEALRGDLAEARRAAEYRQFGEALLSYLKQVPPRSARVVLPDPADSGRNLSIALDPAATPQVNAARYFRRAAKAERGLKQVPPRLSAVEAEAHALAVLLARVAAVEEGASDSARSDDAMLDRDLEMALARLPAGLRGVLRAPPAIAARAGAGGTLDAPSAAAPPTAARDRGRASVVPGDHRAPAARLQPRRLRSREGWDVLIGRTNEGNDYLTHQLARPEDYWFHVHGASGSHVVLRRGKSKDEPSKRTLEEVASWAAFYSQARTAGKVPVLVTRKKYVRKPRKGPPGLALCTNEKTLIVRPQEPEREALADGTSA